MMSAKVSTSQPRRLTNAQIEAAKPRDERYELSDGGSPLRLIVFPSGAKSWAVRFRSGQRTRKLTLGRYPVIGLKDARTLAGGALTQIAKGSDPAEEKRRARERKADSVRAVVNDYVEKWQRPRNRTADEVESSLHRVLVSKLSGRDIRNVTRRDLIRQLEGRNRRTHANVKRFFNWCVEQDLIDVSPAAGIRPADPITSRDRVMSTDELRAFLTAIEGMGEPWNSVFELLALTAQRRTEVAEAAWPEFDLRNASWTIAKERSKNGRAHFVPLSQRALEIIKAQPTKAGDGFLFPAAKGGAGAVSGFSKAKRRLDQLMLAELKKGADAPDRVELKPWRLHDLRRTAATGMAANGVAPHVVEAVLNHTSGAISGVAAVYNRFDYGEEKRAALDEWAQFLRELKVHNAGD